MKKNSAPARTSTATPPTAIPAIAPLERPLLLRAIGVLEAVEVAEMAARFVGEGLLVGVAVIVTVLIDEAMAAMDEDAAGGSGWPGSSM